MPISKEIHWVETPLKNHRCGSCEYCKWDSQGQQWWCLCDESDWYKIWFDEDRGDIYRRCEYYKKAKQTEDAILLLPKERIYTYQKKDPDIHFYVGSLILADIFNCRHRKVAIYDISYADWFKYDSQDLWDYFYKGNGFLFKEKCKENETYEEYGKYKAKRIE